MVLHTYYFHEKAIGTFIKIEKLDTLRTEVLDFQMACLPIYTTNVDANEF